MKRIITIIFTTLLLIFCKPSFGQTISNVVVSPSNLTDCTNISVAVDATQLCLNYIYNGINSNVNVSGGVITVSLEWQTPGPICLGALSFIQSTENLGQVPAGTYTLDVVTILDGVVQQTQSQQINVISCCPVSTTTQGSTNICLGQSATLTGSATNSTSAYWSLNGINVSNNATLNLQPTIPGNYTYYYVATDGSCTDSTAQTLVVNNYPMIDLGNDTSLCVGQSVLLNAGINAPGTTYNWSTGTSNSNYNATMPGTYSVVASTNGCTAGDTIVITGLATPTFSLGNDTTLCDGSTVDLDATATGNGITYAWSGGSSSTMPMITVSTAGNYQITATNNIGCSFTDDITVSYEGIPMPNLGNDTTLCLGEIITLNASTNPTGIISWNTGAGDPVITVSNAGTYSVTVTSAAGCVGSDAVTINYSSVNIDLGGDTLDLINANPLTLDAGNAGGTYLWNTGETTQSITVDTSGTYDVTVTDMFGCTATSSVVIINTTSTNGLFNTNFKVYPNPAQQYIIVEAKGTAITMARIINITGQVVETINVQNQAQISVEHLVNGVYFIQFSNRDGQIIGQTKFVKQ